MPVIYITKPSVIKFYCENYEKETHLRVNWVDKNREKINKAAKLNRKPTNYTTKDINTYRMYQGLKTIIRDHVVAEKYRRRTALPDGSYAYRAKDIKDDFSIEKIGIGSPADDPRLARPKTDLSSDPIMRPVDENISKILYKSKPVYGRKVYLERRSKNKPEDKYYFAECSYWDYGWRLKDFGLHQMPTCGKSHNLTRDTLKNRSGPQPDPVHYKSPDVPPLLKCTI